MAGAPECMVQDGRGSVFIGTFLVDGTSINVCDEHFEGFLISSLSTVTGKDVALALAEVEPSEADSLGEFQYLSDDPGFQEWLDTHNGQIRNLVSDDVTFEQAVQILLDQETTPPDPDDSTVESTN